MRNMVERIERLEEVYSPPEIIVIMLTHWGGELKGWKGDSFYVGRKPGESEEALANRAAGEARVHHNQHSSRLPGYIVLQMARQDVLKPEPGPESIPMRAVPKAQPEITVIRDWMT